MLVGYFHRDRHDCRTCYTIVRNLATGNTWFEFCLKLRLSLGPWLVSNLMHKIPIYLHIIHLLNSSTCFEHYLAHLQEVYVVIVYMQPLVSSLSAGDCHLQRVTIPEAAHTQLRRGPPDDEQG